MIPYSLHVAILLAVCLLFYKLLLQKETYYRLNRAILLTCIALAFVLPLIPVPQKFSLQSTPPAPITVVQPEVLDEFPVPIDNGVNQVQANKANQTPASTKKTKTVAPVVVPAVKAATTVAKRP